MQGLIVFALLSCLTVSTHAFLLSPSILTIPCANKTICNSERIDKSNSPGSYEQPLSYFKCANDAHLRIISCTQRVATPAECVLNFQNNEPAKFAPGVKLLNTDCTPELIALCEDKHECSFNWNMLPQVVPDYPGVKRDYPVHVRDLLAQVVFKCENKRNPTHPFANKRYNKKFHMNFEHPLRRISYNRLQQL